MMPFTFLKVSRVFLLIFLLSFLFQIRTLFYNLQLYQTGEFDFYTSFFLYASDLFFLAAFLAWGLSLWRKESTFQMGDKVLTYLLFGLLVLMGVNVFFVSAPQLHIFLTFRFVELFLLYFMIVNKVLRQQEIVFCLLIGFCFQALVGVFQYFLQSSIGVGFLGEQQVNAGTLGVAKIDFGGHKILRSFGTQAQANVLGGLMFFGILYSVTLLKKNRRLVAGVLCLLTAALILSFSRSALIALVVAFLMYISIQHQKAAIKYVALALSCFLFFLFIFRLDGVFLNRFLVDDLAAAQERTMYLNISHNMLLDHPLGVGLGGFTLHMQDYTTTKLLPWLFQPVHNIFLLMAAELGVAGGLLFCIIFLYSFWSLLKLPNKAGTLLGVMLAGITLIGFFDHYFVTIYQGQVLLFVYFAFVSSLLKSERLPSKKS